ncbi:hypothetical protein RCL1_004228 [Eukaryota sp. TZLM3-RCL]
MHLDAPSSLDTVLKLEDGYKAVSDEINELKKQLQLHASKRKAKLQKASTISSSPPSLASSSPPPPEIDDSIEVLAPSFLDSPTIAEDITISPPKTRSSKYSPKTLKQDPEVTRNFIARQEQLHLEKSQRNEELKKVFDEIKSSEIKPTPEINPQSKKLDRNLNVLLMWGKEKEKRIQELKEAESKQLSESLRTATPKINQKSAEIMRSKSRSKRVENDLLLSHYKKQQEIEKKVKQQEQERLLQAKPKISNFSSNLSRDGDVADRLYALSKQPKAQNSLTFEDPDPGLTFSPAINPISRKLVRNTETLFQEAEVRQHLLDRKRKVVETIETSRTVKPSAMTEKLAKNYEQRTGEGAIDRLTRPKSAPKRAQSDEKNTLFKPRLCKNSREIAGVDDPVNRTEKLYREAEERKRKLELKRSLEERMEEAKLTEERSKLMTATSSSVVTDDSHLFERQQKWKSRLEQKRQHERLSVLKDELSECTFNPSLNQNKSFSNQSPPSYTKGTTSFVKRLNEARLKEDEKKEVLSLVATGGVPGSPYFNTTQRKSRDFLPASIECLLGEYDDEIYNEIFAFAINEIVGSDITSVPEQSNMSTVEEVSESKTRSKISSKISRPRTPRRERSQS